VGIQELAFVIPRARNYGGENENDQQLGISSRMATPPHR
jgi:hypothetical protein